MAGSVIVWTTVMWFQRGFGGLRLFFCCSSSAIFRFWCVSCLLASVRRAPPFVLRYFHFFSRRWEIVTSLSSLIVILIFSLTLATDICFNIRTFSVTISRLVRSIDKVQPLLRYTTAPTGNAFGLHSAGATELLVIRR
jgi:hypothetical protein